MAGIEVQQLFRNVADLKRRGLVQQRGVWRAVLPHAVANRLAARALSKHPAGDYPSAACPRRTDRLLKSFSRRLGYLDTSKEAITLVRQWFGEGAC